jgi:hypothetical protein
MPRGGWLWLGALALACDPSAAFRTVADGVAGEADICVWFENPAVVTADELAALEPGDCFVAHVGNRAVFVDSFAECSEVEADGQACAVLVEGGDLVLWTNRLEAKAEVELYVAHGDGCTCEVEET